MPTFGSLFAGIGGLDLGLERAGWECRWQVEIDPYCQRVLKKHWPSVRLWGPVETFPRDAVVQWGPVPLDDPYQGLRVDLIAGGFPCQPVSVAGRRQGQDDERWLWPEFERVVRVLRPRYVLVENVPGLLHRGMGDVLGDLASLGFDAEWSTLSACSLGAPHTRDRVFVVAHTAGVDGDSWGGVGQGPGGVASEPTRGLPGLATLESGRLRDSWLEREPKVGRMAHGFPSRTRELQRLGNAVVPQVAEWIGRRLIEVAR